MDRLWTPLNNPFLNATRDSHEKGLAISRYTNAALLGDPATAALFDYYDPLHLDYDASYAAWVNGGGQQKRFTGSLKSLLKGLTVHVNDWDFGIQQVHRKGTNEYVAFFPKGHTPFLTGKQETRIAAVSALNIALTGIAPLAAVKTSVNDYYGLLTDGIDNQKNKMYTTDTLSDDVEAKRIAACQGLYYVLGGLMQIYNADPSQIAKFFDLELIRREGQNDFTGHILPQEHETVAKRTLDADQQITLKNLGLVPLTFYMAAINDGPIPAGTTGITLQPSEQTHVPASSLGDVAANKFLTVYNPSELADGNWEVII